MLCAISYFLLGTVPVALTVFVFLSLGWKSLNVTFSKLHMRHFLRLEFNLYMLFPSIGKPFDKSEQGQLNHCKWGSSTNITQL